MTTNNPNASMNHWSPLSEEMERTLRLLAWKDEIFREALIADPKGIIHYLFHQILPNGKLPDDLTIKVVEQDPFTRHIVLPAFAKEEPILEIAEEEQLDLIVNLGALDKKRPRESDDTNKSAGADESKHDVIKQRAKETEKRQKSIKETKIPMETEFARALLDACRQDKKIAQAMKQALTTDRILKSATIQMMQEKGYLSDFEIPKDVNYKLLKDTEETYHIVLPSLSDAGLFEEIQLKFIADDAGRKNGEANTDVGCGGDIDSQHHCNTYHTHCCN